MLSAAYRQAVFQEPPTVLGLRLSPLSAGHLLLLEEADALNGTESGLITAVSICAQPYEDAKRHLFSPCFARRMARFALKVYGLKRIFTFKKATPVDWNAEWAKFVDYYKEAHKEPVYEIIQFETRGPRKPEKKSGLPVLLKYKIGLVSNGICTEQEFWNRPFAQSVWDWIALMESQGCIRVQTDEETAAMEFAAKLAAQSSDQQKEAA